MTSLLATALADALEGGTWRTQARPSQLPPPGDWRGWLMLAGRGFGKTRAGSGWVHDLVETGQAGRIALVAPTAADARDTIVEGESGLLATAPKWMQPVYESSKRRVTWPNGAIATLYSSEEPERLRGPNHDAAWADELCAWDDPLACWDMLEFTLRKGNPRWLVTTTPKPIKLLRTLMARSDVVMTRGDTYENAANLSPSYLATLRERYEGTRLGRQEIQGDVLSDTPGALWTLEWLDRDRFKQAPKDLRRVVVAIDPAVSTNEGSDETGIIGAGVDDAKHCYVLRDDSGRYAPHEWARKAVAMYKALDADLIIAEVNNGGDMVEETLRRVAPGIPFKKVHASRGKVTRAEPIAAMYEQRKVHHVGAFATLEDQMTSFTIDFNRARMGYSPDRVDGLVWALSELSGLTNITQSMDFYEFLGGGSNWRDR